ncbi:peptide ABC transporter permease [Weissella confusa]|uniref:ABC transporter permease n=1 Tax=Weissella confusa TaxID=1583 RepID=UPI0008FE9F75|nr:ABC transporter permease [Weissella confusa]OJF03510.1 peptide ABC transporter permease [Weissella confusa]
MQRVKHLLAQQSSYLIWIGVMALLVVLTLFVPLLPLHPNVVDVANMSQGPTLQHWFGTDDLGRDYLARVIYGGRISLMVGFLSMAVSVVLGTLVGTIAGYYGGWIDVVLMRLLDVFSAIPWLVLVVVLSAMLRPGLMTIIVIISIFSWMSIARLVRAEVVTVKERDFVVYAQFVGEKSLSIMWHHLIPMVAPIIVAAAGTNIANAIMTESALSFLGMGVQDPTASWGSLLNAAQSRLQDAPYMAIIPGVFIMLTVLAFNKLGNLLRDALSPEEYDG